MRNFKDSLASTLKSVKLVPILVFGLWALPTWASAPVCQTVFSDYSLTVNEYNFAKKLTQLKAIPKEAFQSTKPNEMAKAMVYRVREQELRYDKELRMRKDQESVDLQKDSEIILFFSEKIIDSISKYGFLNQHQTGQSAGLNNSKVRQHAEDWYSDLKLGNSNEAMALRAKSAYLNIRANKFLGKRRTLPHLQFGNIAAVFKDPVKDQSIWTAFNSLEVGKIIGSVSTAKGTIGKLVNKCTQCVIGKTLIDPNISGKSLLPYKGTFKSDRISTAEHNSYHEVLIYGEVAFKDVSHFLVTDFFSAKYLVKYGKPIYFSEVREIQGRPFYPRTQLLFDGEKAADSSYGRLLGI